MTDLDSDAEIDLVAQRRTRSIQNRVTIRLKNKLQNMLDSENPLTLDLHELQGHETAIQTALHRATRCNDNLVELEVDETLIEEDATAWLVNLNKTRRLCQELIALRVSGSLIESAEPLPASYETEVAANPSKDYSSFAARIADFLKEAGETLMGSTISSRHEYWTERLLRS